MQVTSSCLFRREYCASASAVLLPFLPVSSVPPPITTTLQDFFTRSFLYPSPSFTAGLIVQRIGRFTPIRFPAHPMLHEIHLRISFSSTKLTLFTHSGSAIRPRPIPMRSASPLSKISSATCGSPDISHCDTNFSHIFL